MTDSPDCIVEGCERHATKRSMCSKDYLKWWRANGKQPRPFSGSECSTDGCVQPAGGFSGFCRPCYLSLYEVENIDRIRARKSADRPRIRERETKRSRVYRAANPEKFAAANERFKLKHPDRVKATQERYRLTDRGNLKAREKGRRRRARMREVFTELVDYEAIVAEFGMVCHLCGSEIATRDDLHMDHVIPIAKGGPHTANNIRPSHALCNLRKGDRVA